jgi:predicted DNA-binding WGR domain protein
MRIYISPSRYYAVAVQHDLFGQTVIIRSWGGRWSRSGGTATEPYSRERMNEIDKTRRAHGYARL